MKTKYIKNANKFPIPQVCDLFGEVIVTHDDVIQWVENVARLPKSSPRFEWYVKNWCVVDKIKRVKIEFMTLDNYFLTAAANDARY